MINRSWAAVVAYIAAIVVANLAVAAFGPGVTILDAFVFIGLDLTLRDALQERLRHPAQMLGVIAAGGVASWLVNGSAGQIALASTVAFLVAALGDYAVYTALGGRARWLRVNGSNTVGSALDSLIFPTLAFGSILPAVVILQFGAKLVGGAFWYVVLRSSRPQAVPA